ANTNLVNIPLTKQAEKVLKITYLEAKIFKTDIIGTEHLLLSILRDEDNLASQILSQHGISYDIFKSAIETNISEVKNEMTGDPEEEFYREEQRKPQEPVRKGDAKSKTPVLDNFGRDLTKSAEDGKLDPIVGREKEIERVSQIL
ncbi:MAG: Clp protease N-terminal domain-containing protein, partial [Bacteroidota bacterium]